MKMIFVAIVVSGLLLTSCALSGPNMETTATLNRSSSNGGATASDHLHSVRPVSAAPTEDVFKEALENIWIEADEFKLDDISVTRKCTAELENDYMGYCELWVKSKGKTIRSFSVEHGRKYWLKYGLLDLLGTGHKQLIIFRYSGGAHCCYDYTIFDLKPRLRIIYHSDSEDSANVVGNELIPVDIDNDGVYEFHRDVMAFHYMGAGGHAGASFPPAIYAYDKNVGKYIPATKRFPNFVMEQLNELLSKVEGTSDSDAEALAEFRVRTKFLFMVYAGERDAGWKYFEENYRSPTGNGYQEKFKEQFKAEFSAIFSRDPTYLSIYGSK